MHVLTHTNRHLLLCALVALATLNTACAVHAPHLDSAVALPDQFLATGPAGMDASGGIWWRGLGDPALVDAIDLALEQNPGLLQVAARLRAASATVDARTAGLIPSLSASGSASQDFDTADDSTLHSAGLSAAYEVDLWGRVRAARQAAVLDLAASAQALATARITLVANVAIQWFQVGTTQEILASIRQQRADYDTVLQLVETRYRNGQATVADVLQQRQLIESTRSLEASTLADLAQQQHALDALLGIPAGASAVTPTAPVSLPAVPATGVPANTITQRPDVQQAWLAVASADRDVAAAVANRFPQLNLSVSYSSNDAGMASLFDDWMGNLLGTLALPLIDGGSRRAEVARTRAVLDEQLAAYRETVLTAFGEVQDALVLDQQQQRQIASLEEQVRLSDAVVDRQLRQLRNGSIEFPSLLDAQISSGSLRRDLLSARQALMRNRIALYRALAGPLPTDSEATSS